MSKPATESKTHGTHRSRIFMVPINKMRVPPELVVQRPFITSHGNQLAANLDLNLLGLPVLNHRDGVFWIVDGQHRIFALRENDLGNELLECEVYENLSDADMARKFLGRDARRAISPMAKFHVACTAEMARESAIRRAVETQGLKVSRSDEDGCIGAVGALGKVYDRCGEVVLGQVLRVIKHAWGSDAASFHQSVIVGLGLLFNRYGARANEKRLSEALSLTHNGVRGVLRRAEDLRNKTGNEKSQCVAAVIVEMHNKRSHRSERMAEWWKQEPAS